MPTTRSLLKPDAVGKTTVTTALCKMLITRDAFKATT